MSLKVNVSKLNESQMCDLVTEVINQERVDLGTVLLISGEHPKLGNIVIVNNSAGEHGLVIC